MTTTLPNTLPKTDEEAIRAIIATCVAAGLILFRVDDGDPAEDIRVTTADEAVEAIMAVESASLIFKGTDGKRAGFVWFVLGNEPMEVGADNSVGAVDDALQPLVDRWIELERAAA